MPVMTTSILVFFALNIHNAFYLIRGQFWHNSSLGDFHPFVASSIISPLSLLSLLLEVIKTKNNPALSLS